MRHPTLYTVTSCALWPHRRKESRMPSAPTGPKARIDPQRARVRLRLGAWFDFKVGKDNRIDVNWTLIDPVKRMPSALGKMNGNRVQAAARPTQSHAVLKGETLDKKFSAEAQLFSEIEWDRSSPVPVDDWSAPPIAEGTPWNTQRGRRAWLLMMDVLYQLPDKFLDTLGQIYLVRTKEIFWGKGTAMHWPFDRRAV